MADLLVRGVDEEIVRALEEQARAHGRTAEAEHREILSAALAQPRRRRSLAELLEATHNDPRGLTAEEPPLFFGRQSTRVIVRRLQK